MFFELKYLLALEIVVSPPLKPHLCIKAAIKPKSADKSVKTEKLTLYRIFGD